MQNFTSYPTKAEFYKIKMIESFRKCILSILVLGISFNVSIAQQSDGAFKANYLKAAKAKAEQALNEQRVAQKKQAMLNADQSKGSFQKALTDQSDLPAVNQQLASQKQVIGTKMKMSGSMTLGKTFTPNNPAATATFTGSLGVGDCIEPLRLFRNGVQAVCGSAKAFPGTAGGPSHYYDTYSVTNTTGASACITVTLTTTDLVNANIMAVSYLGSFNPANLGTNYLGDAGLSTGTPATAPLIHSYDLANGATAVIVVNSANPTTAGAGGTASNYTLTVDGLASSCAPPSLPNVTGNLTVCAGGSTTLSVACGSASLNSATAWKWYSGSCGGTLVGTGPSITVSPAVNTTYYVRGEGGCVGVAGPCTAVNVVVQSASTAAVLSQVQIPGPPVNLIDEGFNVSSPYPASALPAGWSAAFLSQPPGLITVWYQGVAGVFTAFEGANYIAANYNHAGAALGTLSSWMFPPAVVLKNGDKFSFYTRHDPGNARPDRLQVRMNTTNNGTNVGATATSVGDFTNLLLDINPTYQTTGYPTVWTQYTITLSGLPAAGFAGRLAFRYFCENSGGVGVGINSDYIGIDKAVYTTYPTLNPTTCTGSTANLKVDITGGPGLYNLVLNANPPGGPGGNFNVNNYTSGANIPVTPPVTTTYSIVSVTSAAGCVGTGNSGTPTVVVLPATITGIQIQDNPTGPLCAGDPKLLTVVGAGGPATFTNSNPITITDNAITTNPLVVSGLATSGVTVQSVNINSFSHTWSGDVNMVLQHPNGTTNVILKGNSVNDPFITASGVNLVFSDAAAGSLPLTSPMASGTYLPTNRNGATFAFLPPGPTVTGPTFPASPTLSTFTGDMNGTWKLFVEDRVGGDVGSIAGGYSITFFSPPAPPPLGWTFLWGPSAPPLSSTSGNPVAASPMVTTLVTVLGTAPGGCQTSAQILITVLPLPAVTTQPSPTTICANGNASFSITATGAGITYQWQVSTDNGATYNNIANGALYGGVTTPTMTITGATFAMNGWRYRCVVSGTCPPAANSNGAILTVNPLPAVTISPAGPVVCGGLPGINGTALTASGATSYVWSPVTGLYIDAQATIAYTGQNLATVYAAPVQQNIVYTVTGTNGATGCVNTATITVVYTPSAPTVAPNPGNMCLGDAAIQLCVTSSLAPQPFTSTYSSGPISVICPDNTPSGSTSTINVPLPSTASITNMRVTWTMPHTWDGDMVFALKAPNGQILNLDYYLSNTGGTGPTTGFTNTTVSSSGSNALSTGTNPYTGTFKADALNAGIGGTGGPTGYTPTVTTWAPLYTIPNGNWVLAMKDGFGGDQGTLTSWSLSFDYLYGPPAAGIWSPATGLYSDAAATIAYVAGTPATCVYARPLPSGTYPYTVTVQSVGPDAFPIFTNPAPITINDNAITTNNLVVAGLPTTGVSVQSVKINGFSHTWSGDVNMVLQSPTATNVIIKGNSVADPLITASNVNLTFDDGAAGSLPLTSPMASGTYLPTNRNGATFAFLPPGPTVTGPTFPASPTLSTFTGNMNGTWKLYVEDRVGGDVGSISGGYSIIFKYAQPGCTSPPATVTVNVWDSVKITVQPVNAVVCTNKTTSFTVSAVGTSLTYQWQVSADGGNTWTNISNGAPYSGATTATLTITSPSVTLNGNLYRVVVSGASPCGPKTSFQRVLTVNPLPTVVINASPYKNLLPGMLTTISSTSSPAAATYIWVRNNATVVGATASSYVVDIDHLGDYFLIVTDVNGCTNKSNTITVGDSTSGRVFISPNPTPGRFLVRYNPTHNNVKPRGINIYDALGKRILTQSYTLGAPFAPMVVDLSNHGTGVYWVEVVDIDGNRLAMGRVEVLR